MIYDIYVIGNSDLFREGLNAIAAYCNSESFHAATWIGAAIGIITTAAAHMQKRDVMIYLKWLITYFFVSTVLLGTPSTVAVIDTSDASIPAEMVDNVPFGLALPAHLITAFGYSFTSGFETVFAMPEEEQYRKTGMMFGSNLFRLSLFSEIDDPELMKNMNDYVKSCVIGDILINKKYSFSDLLHSEDIWSLMTSQPSSIRGMYMEGSFNTCVEAATSLSAKINDYAASEAPSMLAQFLPTRNTYSATAVNTMLMSTYDYFKSPSQTATDILKQNISINAFRAGIQNYAAEQRGVAEMQNISNTIAMNNTRIAWSTSQKIGMETLPMMQVVMLLLMICMFPLIVVLNLIPFVGFSVFKNYIYSLIWLETWPIMYAILNMAMNFYIRAGDHGVVTLSSINLLAQEHSDIQGVAGYLLLAIPFLSIGIVKGMAMTFNSAAQYLGGMMHSIAQSNAASVSSGNYSMGNVSTDNATANNLNANKHDTNYSNMHGMSTNQLANGSTVSTTAEGHDVYSMASGMSQLATSAHAAESASASLSRQIDHSLQNAMTHSSQYMESRGHNSALGSSESAGVSSNVDHAMSTIHNLSHSLAQRENVNESEAFSRLVMASGSVGLKASASAGLKVFGSGASASAESSINTEGRVSGNHEQNHSNSIDKSISSSDAKDFRNAVNVVKNYSKNHSYSMQNTESQNLTSQMGADLNQAERLSESAQFIQSHSSSINTNFNQAFANYVQDNYPAEANSILSATGDSPLLAQQQKLADQFIQTHSHQLSSQFSSDSHSVQRNFSSSGMQNLDKYAVQNFQKNNQSIHSRAGDLGISASQAHSLSSSVEKNINENKGNINKLELSQSEKEGKLDSYGNIQISKGQKAAQKKANKNDL